MMPVHPAAEEGEHARSPASVRQRAQVLHQAGLVERGLEVELGPKPIAFRNRGKQLVDMVDSDLCEHRSNLFVGVR
jgi:hypothetical protein